MSRPRPRLLGLAPDMLVELLGGPGRARAVYAELRAGRDPFLDPSVPAGARKRLAEIAAPSSERIGRISRASDRTTKFLVELEDGTAVESVLIPEASRTTLCVSSQVGCARGCTFCRTATMDLLRNLSAAEICAQVVFAIQLAKQADLPALRNLVFMGMGEPLDNLAAVSESLAIITSSSLGLGFGRTHVTVSSVGPSPRAVRAAASLPARLAWSLHAADDRLRKELVPTQRTQRGSVRALAEAFLEVVRDRGEPLFVEMTLIDGVNDSALDAERAAQLFAESDVEVRFNLLPMNDIGAPALRPSPPARVAAYAAVLKSAGYFAMVRKARGTEEHAACGQLAVLA